MYIHVGDTISPEQALIRTAVLVVGLALAWYMARVALALALVLRARRTPTAALVDEALAAAPPGSRLLFARLLRGALAALALAAPIAAPVAAGASTGGVASTTAFAAAAPAASATAESGSAPTPLPLLDRVPAAPTATEQSHSVPPGAPAVARRTGADPEPAAEASPAADEAPRRVVVVRPGDSLWALAADAASPGSSDQQIAADVGRWYAANRAVIGPDPGLIRPGQRLKSPVD